ncbi:MAG: CRISPR-associated endonuclease Cas2 [Armatimonadota bacterium]|nr:CRISPR-associated endonuclease Cas2 [Armatimonadota bacterium]MDR7409706.1 CRISPR-associated endonuclease Cas2 [Armatimonadota bacterium]
MSRNRYVVCYDVREPKRLRRMHRTMLGYGDPLQYSVFVCDLSATERMLMEDAVRQVVRLSEDSVVVIDLGPAEGVARRRIRQLGEKRVVERDRCVVV